MLESLASNKWEAMMGEVGKVIGRVECLGFRRLGSIAGEMEEEQEEEVKQGTPRLGGRDMVISQ